MCHCSAAYCLPVALSAARRPWNSVYGSLSLYILSSRSNTQIWPKPRAAFTTQRSQSWPSFFFFLQYLGSFPPSKSGRQWEGCQRGAGRQEAMQTPDIWSLKLSDNKSPQLSCGSTLQLHFLMSTWNCVPFVTQLNHCDIKSDLLQIRIVKLAGFSCEKNRIPLLACVWSELDDISFLKEAQSTAPKASLYSRLALDAGKIPPLSTYFWCFLFFFQINM